MALRCDSEHDMLHVVEGEGPSRIGMQAGQPLANCPSVVDKVRRVDGVGQAFVTAHLCKCPGVRVLRRPEGVKDRVVALLHQLQSTGALRVRKVQRYLHCLAHSLQVHEG